MASQLMSKLLNFLPKLRPGLSNQVAYKKKDAYFINFSTCCGMAQEAVSCTLEQ